MDVADHVGPWQTFLSERVQDASIEIVPLFGALDAAVQDRAIAPAPKGQRKVVLATSIAETSLTIEGVRIVVDSGLARVPRYEPDVGLTRLETVRVSRAAADQRRGRAGRTVRGVCYRLWDEPQTASLEPYARPEILSADLSGFVLDLAAWGSAPEQLAFQGRAEDVHVIENLVVNKEQRIPDIAYFRTDADPVSSRNFLLLHGQEFHTSYWGHAALLGLTDHYLLPEYAGYPNTAAASLYPANADVADLAHAQGALFGYVHPFDAKPDPADTTQPLTYELPVDVALGKVDYIEVMGYSDHLITSEIWYRLLNCGFRLPAGAGTDAFPNFASLRGPPGLVRVFVQAGTRLDRRGFLAGLKAGRTFVSNAPLLEFTLDGRQIGEAIRLPRGGGTVVARVRLRSSVPVDHLEIIGNGRVVAAIPLTGDRTQASAAVPVTVAGSGWYVLRAYADRAELPVLDRYPFGSTSPVYVTVGNEPVRSPEDADFFMRWIDRLDDAAEAHQGWNTAAEREHVLRLLAEARGVYAGRGVSGAPARSPGSR